jgi:hypothetical protein
LSADKQGLLESHFAYVGGENTATTKTIQQKDNNNSSKESTLNVGQNIPKAVYFRDVFQASIDEQTKGEKNCDDDAARSLCANEEVEQLKGKVEMDEAIDKTTNNLEHVANENKILKQKYQEEVEVVKVEVSSETKSNSTSNTDVVDDKTSDSQINNIESKIKEVSKNDDDHDKQQFENSIANAQHWLFLVKYY